MKAIFPLLLWIILAACAAAKPIFHSKHSADQREVHIEKYVAQQLEQKNLNDITIDLMNMHKYKLSNPARFKALIKSVDYLIELLAKSPWAYQLATPLYLRLKPAGEKVASVKECYFVREHPLTMEIPLNWDAQISLPVWAPSSISRALFFAAKKIAPVPFLEGELAATNKENLIQYANNLSRDLGIQLSISFDELISDRYFNLRSHFYTYRTKVEELAYAVYSENLVNLGQKKLAVVIKNIIKSGQVERQGPGHYFVRVDHPIEVITQKLIIDSLPVRKPIYKKWNVFKNTSEINEVRINKYAKRFARALKMENIIVHLSHFDSNDIDIRAEFNSLRDIVAGILIKIARQKNAQTRDVLAKKIYIRLIPRYLVSKSALVAFKNPKKRGPEGYIVIDYVLSGLRSAYKEREEAKDFFAPFVLKVARDPARPHQLTNKPQYLESFEAPHVNNTLPKLF